MSMGPPLNELPWAVCHCGTAPCTPATSARSCCSRALAGSRAPDQAALLRYSTLSLASRIFRTASSACFCTSPIARA